MTVPLLWALFLGGVALQVVALLVALRGLGPLGLIIIILTVAGATMVALAIAWGILGEISAKL